MTEAGWGTDLEAPAPKRRVVPVWVWACGGGCALLVVVLALAAWFVMPQIKKWFEEVNDPELQWAKLALVLPYDQPRPDYEIQRIPTPIPQIWVLRDGGLVGSVLDTANLPQDAVREWFDHPEQSPALKQSVRDLDSEKGHITVQGRKFECTRFLQRNGAQSAVATHIAFELAPSASGSRVQFSLSSNREDRPVSDEDVIDFLAPFHVGKDR